MWNGASLSAVPGEWMAESSSGVAAVALTGRVAGRGGLRLSASATFPNLCRKLDGVRLDVVIFALSFHYKMRSPMKKRVSEFCVWCFLKNPFWKSRGFGTRVWNGNRALLCQPSSGVSVGFGLQKVHLPSAFSAPCVAKALAYSHPGD